MSMLTVPSLAPGARTLPGELRVPHGNAYGWHRLHQNLAPLTEPPTLAGLGDTTIPVDPPITISPRNFPNLPPQAAQAALDAISKVAAHYSPQAAVAVAAVLARFGPQVAPQAVASLQAFLARQGVAGLGAWYDESGIPISDPTPIYSGTYDTGSSVDWGSIIGGVSHDITGILAVTQGGSVTNTGIYGSTQTANVAAAYPPNQLSVSGSGISGILSSPMILLLLGAGVLLVMSKR
jgi:hypothetical protein